MNIVQKSKGLLPVGFLCILLFFAIIVFGCGSLEFNGFGIDSNGLLYIGRLHQIEIYNEGKQIQKLTTPADRGWVMAVDDKDNILVSNMSTIIILDTDGSVITTHKDIHSERYYKIRSIRQVKMLDGSIYELKHKWIWPTIQRNGTTIYRVPFADFVTRVLFVCGSIFLLVGIVACKLDKKDQVCHC